MLKLISIFPSRNKYSLGRTVLYILGILRAPQSRVKIMSTNHRKSNVHLSGLISELRTIGREKEAGIWRTTAKLLEKSSKNWPSINVSRLEYNVKGNEKIVVPGKLLGSGSISKKVTVGAYSFSDAARVKIEAVGGKCVGLAEMAKKNPKGSGLRLMG